MTSGRQLGRPGEPPSSGASRAPRAPRASRRILLILAAASLMLAACSSSSEPSGAGSPAGGGEEVTIQGFIFRPNELTVAPGTKVTWENQDEILHTVTAEDGSFDLELPDQGTQVSFTFEVPGTYDYACSRHPSMMGVVIVEGT